MALGYEASWQTVRRIMREHGLLNDPSDLLKTQWREFLNRHWGSLAACDFFTVEAWG